MKFSTYVYAVVSAWWAALLLALCSLVKPIEMHCALHYALKILKDGSMMKRTFEMLSLKKGDTTIQKGVWEYWGDFVVVSCPLCGGLLLGEGSAHRVDKGGHVFESVKCLWKNCTFHEYVRLMDYDGQPRKGKG